MRIKYWRKLKYNELTRINVCHVLQAQMSDPDSIWNLFHNLTLLRKDTPSFEYGDYIAAVQDDDVFSFVREYDGEKG